MKIQSSTVRHKEKETSFPAEVMKKKKRKKKKALKVVEGKVGT